jgi:hypothetical protein
MRRLFVVLVVLLTASLGAIAGVTAQGTTKLATPVPNSETTKLIDAINAYRATKGLPAIPVSPELTTVAMDHVHDLMRYGKTAPEYTGKDCVPHGWSSHGPWKGGCYKYSDPASGPLMWNKPKEIANYPGNGYEILFESSDKATAADALKAWQADPPHDNVIINQDIWKPLTWKAIGVWVEDGYASVWFGEQTDPTPLNATKTATTSNQPANGGAPQLPSTKATTPANGGAPVLPGATTTTPSSTTTATGGTSTATSTASASSTSAPTMPATMMPTSMSTEPPTMAPTAPPASTEPPTEVPTM